MTTTINRDEWLAAVAEAEEPNDPDALTAKEFAALIGMTRNAANARLHKLVEMGKATQCRKRIQDESGRRQVVSAYKLVKTAPAPAPKKAKR